MKERWGGGEKGFKLIFTARKELVIHTIWGERAVEAARLPPAQRLWSQAGTLRPDRVLPGSQPRFTPRPVFSMSQTPTKPNRWARPPSSCAFFYREQNKRRSFTTPALFYYSPDPPTQIPAPPPSNIHMWFLFNPSEMVAGGGGERRGGMRLFIKCQPFKLIPLMDSPTSWCAFK